MTYSLRHEAVLEVIANLLAISWISAGILFLNTIAIYWSDKTHAADAKEFLLDENPGLSIFHMKPFSTERSHLSIKNIYDMAREYTTENLPNETYQVYPIPVRDSGGMNLVFLWGISRAVPGEGRHYISPHWMVKFGSSTGKLVMEKHVLPTDFGQTIKPGQFIGTYYWKKDSYSRNRGDLEDRLYELLDRLLPYFTKEKQIESPPTLRITALEFKDIFSKLSKQFLRPYYCAVGRDFFAWVDDLANSELPPFCTSP